MRRKIPDKSKGLLTNQIRRGETRQKGNIYYETYQLKQTHFVLLDTLREE